MMQLVNPKANLPWIFIGRTDIEAEAPILWSPDMKSLIIGKDPDAGKDWRWEENPFSSTESEMIGWHHQFNRCEVEQTPGDSEQQGRLACYSSWGRKESDITLRLNWTPLLISPGDLVGKGNPYKKGVNKTPMERPFLFSFWLQKAQEPALTLC